jgi:hypothetical protein
VHAGEEFLTRQAACSWIAPEGADSARLNPVQFAGKGSRVKLVPSFSTQPRWMLLTECFLLSAVIGVGDWTWSWEVSFFVFYGPPIFIAAWHANRWWGLFFAGLAALIWYVANCEGNPYESRHGYQWVALNRAVYFGFVAIGSSAIRAQREQALARLDAVTRARELEQEIVRASEREQTRIGQDLHDGVCQNLAAIDCAAECLCEELEKVNSPQAEAAAQIQRFLKETLLDARNIARGIFPVQIETEGLAAALDELVTRSGIMRGSRSPSGPTTMHRRSRRKSPRSSTELRRRRSATPSGIRVRCTCGSRLCATGVPSLWS